MIHIVRLVKINYFLVALIFFSGCGDTKNPSSKITGTSSPINLDIYSRVMKEKHVRVGVKTDTPPFGMKAGSGFTGYDVDIAMAITKQLGIDQVDFVPVTSANRIIKLLNGDVDMVIASMTITRYRELKIDFTRPYFQDGQALLVPSKSQIQSYLDLPGKNVGCVKGSTSSYYMKQVAPDCTTKIYTDFNSLMNGLSSGEVDAVTSDMLILVGLIKGASNPNDYRIAGDRFTTEPYGIGVLPNQSKWRNALDEAIQELWENGRWQTITDSWFGEGAKYESKITFAITPFPH